MKPEAPATLPAIYDGWLQSRAPELPASLREAIRRLVAAVAEGHVCVGVQAEPGWFDNDWLGGPGAYKPFILDDGRLYLARYHDHENVVARSLLARAALLEDIADPARLRADLGQLFSGRDPADRQQLAAVLAQLKPLTLISGGPGTGKTSTVLRILALLLGQRETLRIGLAAPTGKAAQRLVQAMAAALDFLESPPAIKALIPAEATTVHRLLGALGDTGRYRHGRDNPLPLDVLVIDEASMIDLALMRAVLDALPPSARLILLGDKDQLASVEAGSVYGDICAARGPGAGMADRLAGFGVTAAAVADAPPLGDCRVELTHSYRFAAGSGIGHLAAAARDGDAPGFLANFGDRQDIAWMQQPAETDALFRQRIIVGYGKYLERARAGDAAGAFAAFAQLRVLCAHRQGRAGVEGLNRLVEALLECPAAAWYAGRPVMISANDHMQRLFNGDIGLCLPTDQGLRVVFEAEAGQYRQLLPARVPAHETAWALTVHKSQGSEFDDVLLVLPEQLTPVLNRPLVYTAVTRAKKQFALWAAADVVTAALATLPLRESGLRARLGQD